MGICCDGLSLWAWARIRKIRNTGFLEDIWKEGAILSLYETTCNIFFGTVLLPHQLVEGRQLVTEGT